LERQWFLPKERDRNEEQYKYNRLLRILGAMLGRGKAGRTL
jgi:hypothetical protein